MWRLRRYPPTSPRLRRGVSVVLLLLAATVAGMLYYASGDLVVSAAILVGMTALTVATWSGERSRAQLEAEAELLEQNPDLADSESDVPLAYRENKRLRSPIWIVVSFALLWGVSAVMFVGWSSLQPADCWSRGGWRLLIAAAISFGAGCIFLLAFAIGRRKSSAKKPFVLAEDE